MGVKSSLLYIAGAGRSGTTIVDLLLNQHPEIVGLGQVQRLSLEPGERLCSCGKAILQCTYWNSVAVQLGQTRGDHAPVDWRNYTVTMSRSPQRLNETLVNLALVLGSRHLMEALSRHNQRGKTALQVAANSWDLFDAVAEVNSARFVVDSTKDARRLKYLYLWRPEQSYVLHMVRDGRAVMASAMRREGVSAEMGARAWVRANRVARVAMLSIPRHRILLVRYEDFCRQLDSSLARILRFSGASPTEFDLELERVEYHLIPGNPMLFSRPSKVLLDDRWRTELSTSDLATFDHFGGRMNRSFGYS